MSTSFWAWVAGPWGTLAGMSVALVVGTALGWLAGRAPRGVSRRERRELADAAADRAARQFRRMRQPELREPTHWRQVDHQRQGKTSTAAFLAPPEDVGEAIDPRVQAGAATDPQRSTDRSLRVGNPPALPHPAAAMAWSSPRSGLWRVPELDPQEADETWMSHTDQALALANGSPIDTGEIRAITEGMDVFLGRLLAEHPVLYPDDHPNGPL